MKKKWSFSRLLNRIANYTEMVISIIIIFGVAILLINVVSEFFSIDVLKSGFDFDGLLERLLSVTIGIEFTRMLCRHTPDTVIEVLIFATARHLILNHSSSVNTLFGVISIGILFLLRKYFLPNDDENSDENGFKVFIGKLKEKRNSRNQIDSDDESA